MRVVGRELLEKFSTTHGDARAWTNNWIAEVEQATWRTPHDVKRQFAAASFLSDNVAIFNVRGNKYRLETQISYEIGVVGIRWVGTHTEYDRRSRRR
ncbi:MAG: type II toxin-antitoxin system HigB family toxin [Gammaproteobacteria bacterium]|nr:type II toxin-antitoxin system HigB family toxin [Gammaproteobacteria bacterium]